MIYNFYLSLLLIHERFVQYHKTLSHFEIFIFLLLSFLIIYNVEPHLLKPYLFQEKNCFCITFLLYKGITDAS